MKARADARAWRPKSALALAFFCLAALSAPAAVITREQELENRARRLFESAQKEALRGRPEEALRKFEAVVKAYGRSSVAAQAQWEVVRLNEAFADHTAAFDAMQLLIDHYPGHFEKALRRQFEIALRQLARYDHMQRLPEARKPRDLPDKEQVSAMLRIVIENGPHAEYVAEASYHLAVALEMEGKVPQAAMHHEEFLERFPDHPLADDSAYQVAYIFYKRWLAMKGGAPASRERAALAMRWFLARYAESDKAAQARACLDEIRHAERVELTSLAAYYEKRGDERASAVYYRELASKFPELAPEGSALRERVSGLLHKYPELMEPEETRPFTGLPVIDPLALPATLKPEDVFDFSGEP